MLRTLEPQKGAENKNAEADFNNPCSYKMKSVYLFVRSLLPPAGDLFLSTDGV